MKLCSFEAVRNEIVQRQRTPVRPDESYEPCMGALQKSFIRGVSEYASINLTARIRLYFDSDITLHNHPVRRAVKMILIEIRFRVERGKMVHSCKT